MGKGYEGWKQQTKLAHNGARTLRARNLGKYCIVRQEYTSFKEIAAVLDRKKNEGYKGPLPTRVNYLSMLLNFAIIIAA